MGMNASESHRDPRSSGGSQDTEERSRVLLVDDDQRFLATIEAVLMDHVDVVACTSAEQALRTLSASKFHLVCSDFGMPGINGTDFLERVSALPYYVATLLITGNERYIRTSQGTSDHYVLLKPFEPERLIRLVLQLARLARMKRGVSSARDGGPVPSDPGSAGPISRGLRDIDAEVSSSQRRRR